MDYGDDSFELLTMDRQAQKKEKQQNRLNKMLAYSSVGIAVGLVGSLLLQIFAMVKAGKGEGSKNLKMVWEDFSKKDNFPALTDDCVNEKVRKFIQNIKDTAGLSDEVMKKAGVDLLMFRIWVIFANK